MNLHSADAMEIEQERLQLASELSGEQGADWPEQYKPGSFGCHELLDRTSLAADHVEQYVLSHPACLQNPRWYMLAQQAVAALRDLYQQVGADHLDTPGQAADKS